MILKQLLTTCRDNLNNAEPIANELKTALQESISEKNVGWTLIFSKLKSLAVEVMQQAVKKPYLPTANNEKTYQTKQMGLFSVKISRKRPTEVKTPHEELLKICNLLSNIAINDIIDCRKTASPVI